MTNLIDKVECTVTITLSNSQTISISLSQTGEPTNYLTSLEINEEMGSENNNPVGVVSSNTLKMAINTKDLSLIPQNSSSQYYGYMNNTATVTVKVESVDGETTFGLFYVSNWKSNITSANPYRVVIEGVDLLSILGKNKIPSTELQKTQSITSYLSGILTKLNAELPAKYRVTNAIPSAAFTNFPTIQYPSYSSDDISTLLNTIAQSTLTNFYLTRANTLTASYLLERQAGQSVGTLSDSVNVTSASLDASNLVNYNSVKVNYYLNTVNDTTLINTLDGQSLVVGDNAFSVPLSGVYKISYIKIVSPQSGRVEISDFSYSKDTLDIILTSDEATTCRIEIYGQTLKENKMSLTVQRQSSSNETLEVTNNLLPESSIRSFATKLLSLTELRGEELTLDGFFNPQLQLGDTVAVDCSNSINESGNFKVIGLNWKIGNTIKCTCKLLKF